MSDNDYGFSPTRKATADKLRAIRPSTDLPVTDSADLVRVDAASAALGFVGREGTRTAILRKRKEIGPTVAINMRVPEAVAIRFIEFCEQNRLSYWEGVDELMRRSKM